MSRGGFIDRHFSFTGDGRSAGTGTLGTAQELALRIVSNVALQLSKAGWTSSNELFSGSTTSAATWIQDGTLNGSPTYLKLYMNSDQDTTGMIEMPMTYTVGNEVTKIWIMYGFGKIVSSTLDMSYCHFNTWLNYLDRSYYWYTINSCPCCITILYCPPGCEKAQCFRGVSYMYGYTNSNFQTIANANSSDFKFNFHVITKDNYIALGEHTTYSSSNYSFVFCCVGNIFGDLYDPLDNICSYRGYGAWNSQTSASDTSSEMSYTSSNQLYKNTQVLQYNYYPYNQFYDKDGNIQFCNNTGPRSDYHCSKGLMTGCTLLQALNTQTVNNSTRKISCSKIILGNTMPSDTSLWGYSSKVSNNNSIKGTIDDSYAILVDYSGYNITAQFPVGQTFDNGNYVHIGSGVCIGWDATNTMSILDVSDNPMLPIYSNNPAA